MAGFIRRYGFQPTQEQIQQIEGAVIVDLPPPGSISGQGTGTVAVVGECADMTYAVASDGAGTLSTSPQPVEIFGAADLVDKIGGWNPTIGDFGGPTNPTTNGAGGNAFVTCRSKKWSRLIIVPINLASAKAVRATRELPTNQATTPLPIVPMQAGLAPAGTEFRSGNSRVLAGAKIAFSADGPLISGSDGAVTYSAGVTQTISSAGSDFPAAGVKKGDIMVLGSLAAASGAQLDDAGTYRVVSDPSVSTPTQVVIQLLDGSAFPGDFSSGTGLLFRIHPASTADTAPASAAYADTAGFSLPARPLDATISAGTVMDPTVVPAAGTATTWNSLSGLKMYVQGGAALTYTAAVQAVNVQNDGSIDALYSTAIDSLLSDNDPARAVNVVISSRASDTINAKLKSHVLTASSQGVGRMTVISPILAKKTLNGVITDTSGYGVAVNRSERVIYCWPGLRTFIPEAVGQAIGTAVGTQTTDGILDTPSNAWLASILSVLPPENNPGQSGPPVDEVMAPVLGLQRGAPQSTLDINGYTSLKQNGVCAPRIDRNDGAIFQSGVTTSLTAGQKNINRRRMADFIQDSIAARYNQMSKQLLTSALKDTIVSETVTFLSGLLSINNPAAQRIAGFLVDAKSGNTPQLLAAGIYTVIAKVQTLASADEIVLSTLIGEGVSVTVN